MFEFAIAQHRKRRPSRGWIRAGLLSTFAHLATLFILIEYPELLRPGKGHWLSHLLVLDWGPRDTVTVAGGWRIVTVVGGTGSSPMTNPSADTLRRYAYDWSRGSGTEARPAVQIRLDRDLAAGDTSNKEPRVNPALGTRDPKPVTGDPAAARIVQPSAPAEVGSRTVESAGAPVAVASGAPAGEGAKPGATTIFLPAPEPVAPRRIPTRIPDAAENRPAGLTTPAAPPAQGAQTQPKSIESAQVQEPTVFADKQSAIRTEGSGLFDTKGFPLGEYARVIIDRVKGNWLIPSNLRNSQGRSTVIFYIEKNGTVLDARIVNSSGSSSLDLAALSSVLGSNPFPPLPQGFPGEQVGAKFVFAYNERQ